MKTVKTTFSFCTCKYNFKNWHSTNRRIAYYDLTQKPRASTWQ